jgi:hypothetical protein
MPQGVQDIVFGGDLNWIQSENGDINKFLCERDAGWVDAWPAARPDAPGFTYDPKRNPMLCKSSRYPPGRLDRWVVRDGWS